VSAIEFVSTGLLVKKNSSTSTHVSTFQTWIRNISVRRLCQAQCPTEIAPEFIERLHLSSMPPVQQSSHNPETLHRGNERNGQSL
jgi:hypothetical protein